MSRRSGCLILALLALLLSPAGAGALTLQRMSSEDFLAPVTTDELTTATAIARRQCPSKVVPDRHLALATALRNAQRFVAQRAGAGAMRQFRASADYGKPGRLELAAAAAAERGVPLAALAALLRQHALAGRDPLPLVDAAAILTEMKHPQEALALLREADRLKTPRQTALGYDADAIMLNNRGHALLTLGQYASARAVLDRAVAREPRLAEARTNRSAADLCQGKTAVARDNGRFRGDVLGVGTPPSDHQVWVEFMGYPEGVGRAAWFSPPPTVEQLAADAGDGGGHYHALFQTFYAAWTSTKAQRDAATQRWTAKPHTLMATRIMAAMTRGIDAVWRKGWDQLQAPWDELTFFTGQPEPDDPSACTIEAQNHQRWAVLYQHVADIMAPLTVELTKTANGYLYALSDPDARLMVRLYAQQLVQVLQADLTEDIPRHVTGRAGYYTGPDRSEFVSCGGTEAPSAAGEAAQADDGKCADPAKKIGALFAEFEIKCEEVSMKVKTGKWVGAFVKLTVNVHEGSLTVLTGGYVSTDLPIPGLKTSVDAGVYVKIDANNRVSDYGVQGPKITTSVGPKGEIAGASMTVRSDGGGRVSMAGAFSGWP